jgi:hypothetical protein
VRVNDPNTSIDDWSMIATKSAMLSVIALGLAAMPKDSLNQSKFCGLDDEVRDSN